MSVAKSIRKTRQQPPHVIVEALAGTGKTTTLVEGLKVLKGGDCSIQPSPQQSAIWDAIMESPATSSVCFVAFNKSIATELQQRVPTGCSAMTIHSMGNKALCQAFGRLRVTSWRVQDIIAELLETDIRELRKKDFTLVQATEKLVGLCKLNLAEGTDEELDQIAGHYDVDLNGSRERVYELVPRVLERCKDVSDKRIDFNDMIWLPVVLNLPMDKYDLLLVDESQDLNRCQQALAKRVGKRLILVGDPHQAIYGFAGADAESMQRMRTELEATPQGCVTFPLTVTRRCGKAIVEEAKKIVEGFEAHESNGAGNVVRSLFADPGATITLEDSVGKSTTAVCYTHKVQPGDMCVCRVTAPLVSQCFRLLKAGRKAEIVGRDIGQGLISTIKKQKATDIGDLAAKLSDWFAKETEKETKKRFSNEAKLIALQDRHDCLMFFLEDMDTVDQVIKRIESIFSDKTDGDVIRFSTIHKAKGLEANRVFLLEPVGATVPHPMAKSAWQRGQEMNLRYVAITRAIQELVYVS